MPAPLPTIVHITGMSGTGKSITLDILARRGWEAIDTDFGDWLVKDTDGDLIWDEPKIEARLGAVPPAGRLVIAGTVRNQGQLRNRFDAVVLLTAPLDIMLDRVLARATNPYGKSTAQQNDIRAYTRTVQPLLRANADLEIDTSMLDPEAVADVIEQFVDGRRPA